MNVRAEAAAVAGQKREEGILPACHRNRAHWLSEVLDGERPKAQTPDMPDSSYKLAQP